MQVSPFCDFRQKTFSTIRKVTWILVILRFYKNFFMRLTWPSQRKRLWASKANILSIFAGARTFLFGTRSCQVMPRIRPGQRRWKALSLRSWGSTGSMFRRHRAACWARRFYRPSFWCWWSAWSCSRPFWPARRGHCRCCLADPWVQLSVWLFGHKLRVSSSAATIQKCLV